MKLKLPIDPYHSLYSEYVEIDKLDDEYNPYNVNYNALSTFVGVEDAIDLICSRLASRPSKKDFKEASEAHQQEAYLMDARWKSLVASTFQIIHGRPFEIFDYQISGIARSEFPENVKKVLRECAHIATAHAKLAYIFKTASEL